MIELKLTKKTRKEHTCVCCGKIIPVGTKAIHAGGFDYDNNPVKGDFLEVLVNISNELAEANRLKRLELKVQITIGHNAQPSCPSNELEDQAVNKIQNDEVVS